MEVLEIHEEARKIRTPLNDVRFQATSRKQASAVGEFNQFGPGDRVILFYLTSRRSKHMTRAIGPCTVVRKDTDNSFTVKHDRYDKLIQHIAHR